MAATGRAVNHRVVHNGWLHIVCADVGLRAHRNCGRRNDIAVHRTDSPLGGAGECEQLRQGDDVPDRVRLSSCNTKLDSIRVLGRNRIRHVAFGPAPRHQHRLRRVVCASKDAALLEVRYCTWIVVCAVEHGVIHRRRNARVWRNVVIDNGCSGRFANESVQAALQLVHAIARRIRYGCPRNSDVCSTCPEIGIDFSRCTLLRFAYSIGVNSSHHIPVCIARARARFRSL